MTTDRESADAGPTEHGPALSTSTMLEAMVAQAPIGFALLDPQLRFILINETLAAINGVPVQEHLGRGVREVLPEIDPSAVDRLQRVLDTGEPLLDVEVSGRTPASSEVKTWMEDFYRVTSASGEVLGVAAVLTDVTAQRLGHRRWAQLIDTLSTFVGLCLPDGTLVAANRTAIETGGLQSSDVIGRKVWDTYWWSWDPEVSEGLRQAVERGRAGEASRYEVEVRMAHGTIVIDFQLVPVIEDGQVVALVPSATDVTARRRSLDQATGLAALARLLNAASTVSEVADAIRTRAGAALGARHATLALLEPGGATLRLLQSPDLPDHLAASYTTVMLDDPLHLARCVRERRTVVLADPLTPQDLEGNEEALARVQTDRAEAGVTISVTAPLFAADGSVIGALACGWPKLEDVDQELQARLETMAEMCAQAIERARLTDAHVVAARRSRSLSTLAGELASAVTVDQIRDAVARLGPVVLGAQSAHLHPLEPPSGEHVTSEPEPADSGPCSGTGPDRRTAGLLLRDNADRVIGSLSITWATPPPPDELLRSTLRTMAELCGQTLERARLHAAEHELVKGLQRRLLQPLPVTTGLDVHAVYRAAQAVGIGGDFYDGLLLADDRLVVVVGDLAGHGVEAAADMAQLRTLLSTLLAAGVPLAELFTRADAALEQTGSLATAAVAVVDVRAQTVTYAHAGHPPFLLRDPDGHTVALTGGRGGMLGIGTGQAAPETVPFPPGSVLVGYTDGLVETRKDSLDVGIGRLIEAVGRRSGEPDEDAARIAAVALDRCVGDQQLDDDLALVVVAYPRLDVGSRPACSKLASGTPHR